MNNNRYDSLLEAIAGARSRGFQLDFSTGDGMLVSISTGEKFNPAQVHLEEYHRFEGETDPGDMSVLYLIETSSGRKGILTDAYGTYASEEVSAFIQKVTLNEKQ